MQATTKTRDIRGPARRRCFLAAAAAFALAGAAHVAAQEAEPGAEDTDDQAIDVCVGWDEESGSYSVSLPTESAAGALECIVVTARRRADLLQDVPLSVSAITAAQIADRAIRDLQDISQETPGLVYENYATAGMSTAAVIRGMGQTFTSARVQNTAVFLDGIYLQRQSMINPGLLDMQRVEVVKGPQNAQFGRNAFAGAVQYVSQRPPDEPHFDIMVGYGANDRFDRRIQLGGPLFDDQLRLRVAAGLSDFDGHSKNGHPFANDGPAGGQGTNGMLGGWRDEVFSAGATWTPAEELVLEFAYHQTNSVREPQAYYDLNGARYAYDTGEFGGPPFFPFLAPIGTNCLNTTTFSDRVPFPASGMHAWCGELPTAPPVLEDPKLAAAGHSDTRGMVAVDPRSLALDADTRISRFHIDYGISDAFSISYQFGRVEHNAEPSGTVEGRASLVGSAVPYVPVRTSPAPPFIQALGPPGAFGAVAQTSIFYANPIEQLQATSHELRVLWQRDDLSIRAGLYVSENEDEDGGRWRFPPACDGVNCGVPVPASAGLLSGRFLAVVPVIPGRLNVGVPHFFDAAHGALADHITYQDDVRALFGDVEWRIDERFTLAVEARVTRERKSFAQLTTTFGAELPENVAASDRTTFNFFTPRAIVKWTPTDNHMLYGLIAKGVKTGGFNAVDPTQNPEQATYDEEQNITFEVGAKNELLGGQLILNAALYRIDWQDVQGTEAASSPDAWARDVVGNIGDAEVTGFEIEGVWRPTERFFVDYGVSYSDAKYTSGVYLSSMAGRNSSWGCDDTVCRADGRVEGKRIERTSKSQHNLGLNYAHQFGGDMDATFRVDFNYRGGMFATPMNLAHNGGRTLANASMKVGGEKWQLALWGRNILDEEYVANSFVLASFNRYIVGLGARRTFGLTLKYGL